MKTNLSFFYRLFNVLINIDDVIDYARLKGAKVELFTISRRIGTLDSLTSTYEYENVLKVLKKEVLLHIFTKNFRGYVSRELNPEKFFEADKDALKITDFILSELLKAKLGAVVHHGGVIEKEIRYIPGMITLTLRRT